MGPGWHPLHCRAGALSVHDEPDVALVRDPGSQGSQGTLEAIYEQNERIIMMLESIAE